MNLNRRYLYSYMRPAVAALALIGGAAFGQEAAVEAIPKHALMETAALAKAIQGGHAPIVIAVPFAVLYRAKHILHAVDGGVGSRPEGIEKLKAAVAHLAKDADIVVYCGCCPMDKCPNVRPAFRALKQMGFTQVRVLNIPTNMHTDWYTKDYPTEAASAATATPR